MSNKGKEFEQDVKDSLSEKQSLWIYRPNDFGGGQSARFTNHSLCDYIIYNDDSRLLYLLELKSVKGKSISCPSISQIKIIEGLQIALSQEEDTAQKKKIKEELKITLKKANSYNIKYHQIHSLQDIEEGRFTNITPYFIINFREVDNKTYIISPSDLISILETSGKSSINIKEMQDSFALELPSSQLRNTKHFVYDFERIIL